ncbi:MAG: hypothetical protein QXY99_05855 [Thermoproteota archaeon]
MDLDAEKLYRWLKTFRLTLVEENGEFYIYKGDVKIVTSQLDLKTIPKNTLGSVARMLSGVKEEKPKNPPPSIRILRIVSKTPDGKKVEWSKHDVKCVENYLLAKVPREELLNSFLPNLVKLHEGKIVIQISWGRHTFWLGSERKMKMSS